MAFQLQDFNSILIGMIADMQALNPAITDYTEGSVIRSLLETYAKQLQKLQLFAFDGIQEGIQTGTYQNFNFQRLPATFASGLIRFFATTPQPFNQVIPAGTLVQVTSNNNTYSVQENTVLPAGAAYVDVFVIANTLGSAGNTPANTISLFTAIGFIASVTNLSPIFNGMDQESDAARLTRFQNYVLSFSRGTTYAIEAAASNVFITDSNGNITERVIQALAVEGFIQDPTLPLGEVSLYIDNGGGTASGALVTLVNQTILGYTDSTGFVHPGYIASGVNLTTFAVQPQLINIVCNVTTLPGSVLSTVSANVSASISNYLQTLTIGEPVFVAALIAAAMNVIGVDNIVFTTPFSDVSVKTGFKAEPGNITINIS